MVINTGENRRRVLLIAMLGLLVIQQYPLEFRTNMLVSVDFWKGTLPVPSYDESIAPHWATAWEEGLAVAIRVDESVARALRTGCVVNLSYSERLPNHGFMQASYDDLPVLNVERNVVTLLFPDIEDAKPIVSAAEKGILGPMGAFDGNCPPS